MGLVGGWKGKEQEEGKTERKRGEEEKGGDEWTYRVVARIQRRVICIFFLSSWPCASITFVVEGYVAIWV